VPHEDELLPPFVDVDTAASKLMAPIVGASPKEVAVMGTLTANLHFLMASFYQPTSEKYKIILEGKAFPSDHVCDTLSNRDGIHFILIKDKTSTQLSLKSGTTTLTQSRLWC
jgi:kynureninase